MERRRRQQAPASPRSPHDAAQAGLAVPVRGDEDADAERKKARPVRRSVLWTLGTTVTLFFVTLFYSVVFFRAAQRLWRDGTLFAPPAASSAPPSRGLDALATFPRKRMRGEAAAGAGAADRAGDGGGGGGEEQEDEVQGVSEAENEERLEEVRGAFLHAWNGYKTFAWGKDTLHPVTQKGSDDFLGMAISIVDAMDTALIMNLPDVFEEQYQWTIENIKFETQEDINVFETTIRIIGGLLSSYAMSGRQPLLDLAVDIGKRLLPAFESATGLPYGTIGLQSGKKYNPSWVKHASSVAEAGTLLLEFRFLSQLTGDPAFKEAVDRVEHFFEEKMFGAQDGTCLDGLFPMHIHPESGEVKGTRTITFGARGDSLYEYFLKGYLQTEKTETWLLRMYEQSMAGLSKHLLSQTSGPKRFTYVSEIDMNEPSKKNPKMDHLVCFVPGMLALGSKNGAGSLVAYHRSLNHMALAESLMRTCYEMYASQPTGLAPEIAHLDQAGKGEVAAKEGAKHSLLRPETVESLFILWRTTGKHKYREWGWRIFQSIQKHARVETGGFSGIKDVTKPEPEWNDKMDSFFLAETLKYLYLLFSPRDVIPLDHYVFNTEAHPLPVFSWSPEP